jgi:hypothetical protein
MPRVWALGCAIMLLAVALGIPALRDNARELRTITGTTDAELGAMQLVQRSAPPDYQPEAALAPRLSAGRYLAAARSDGWAGDSPTQLRADLSSERAQAERVLQELVARLAPASTTSAGTPPMLER